MRISDADNEQYRVWVIPPPLWTNRNGYWYYSRRGATLYSEDGVKRVLNYLRREWKAQDYEFRKCRVYIQVTEEVADFIS